MYLLNGESTHCIDISDRGFQYGDGLFETIEVQNGIPVFLDQHLQRLTEGCIRMLIPPPAIDLLKQEAYQLAQDSQLAVIKLMVTRGSGGRGYRQPDKINPTRLFSLHPHPDYSLHYSEQGINAIFCQTPLGLNPSLAGIKHLNRLEQVMARSEWNSSTIQEGLMSDIEGNVVEGTMTNLLMVKDSSIYTPMIDKSGVAGIIRQIIIQLAQENKIELIEKKLSKQDLLTADELFVSNSIIGIWPVKQLATRLFSVGRLTQQIQQLFQVYKQEAINAQ